MVDQALPRPGASGSTIAGNEFMSTIREQMSRRAHASGRVELGLLALSAREVVVVVCPARRTMATRWSS